MVLYLSRHTTMKEERTKAEVEQETIRKAAQAAGGAGPGPNLGRTAAQLAAVPLYWRGKRC